MQGTFFLECDLNLTHTLSLIYVYQMSNVFIHKLYINICFFISLFCRLYFFCLYNTVYLYTAWK